MGEQVAAPNLNIQVVAELTRLWRARSRMQSNSKNGQNDMKNNIVFYFYSCNFFLGVGLSLSILVGGLAFAIMAKASPKIERQKLVPQVGPTKIKRDTENITRVEMKNTPSPQVSFSPEALRSHDSNLQTLRRSHIFRKRRDRQSGKFNGEQQSS